jgi:hypothetical protein
VFWPFLWVEVPAGFQEEECWLGPVENTNCASIAAGRFSSPAISTAGISLSGSILSAASPIARVQVFGINGRRIATIVPKAGSRTVNLSGRLDAASGAQLLRVETVDGLEGTLQVLGPR